MKLRVAAGITALVLVVASCALVNQSGSRRFNLAQCQSSGGYESVSPFGFPICQADYADAGKVCRSKSDCTGQCLSDAPDAAGVIPVGSPVAGHCERQKSTFGCYARVEDGKLAEPYMCWD